MHHIKYPLFQMLPGQVVLMKTIHISTSTMCTLTLKTSLQFKVFDSLAIYVVFIWFFPIVNFSFHNRDISSDQFISYLSLLIFTILHVHTIYGLIKQRCVSYTKTAPTCLCGRTTEI